MWHPSKQVVHDAHMAEQLYVLESSGDSSLRNLMGLETGNTGTPEEYVSGRWMIDAADAVEERGFTRPVGADHRVQLAFFDGHVQIQQGNDPAET